MHKKQERMEQSKEHKIIVSMFAISILLGLGALTMSINTWNKLSNDETFSTSEIIENNSENVSEIEHAKEIERYINEEMRLSFDYPTEWELSQTTGTAMKANDIVFMSIGAPPYLGWDRGGWWGDLVYAIENADMIENFCDEPISILNNTNPDDFVECEILTNEHGITYAKVHQLLYSEGFTKGPLNVYYFHNPFSIEHANVIMASMPELADPEVFELIAESMRWDDLNPQTTKTYQGEGFTFEYSPDLYRMADNLWTEERALGYFYPPEDCSVCTIPNIHMHSSTFEGSIEEHIAKAGGFAGKTFTEIEDEFDLQIETIDIGNHTFITIPELGLFNALNYHVAHENRIHTFRIYEALWDLEDTSELEEMLSTLSFE